MIVAFVTAIFRASFIAGTNIVFLIFRSAGGNGFPPGGEDTPYNGLYAEAPPERGSFFRLQVYKRVGISQAEVYKRVGKSAI